jgi:lysophospholipase L1-like esterase
MPIIEIIMPSMDYSHDSRVVMTLDAGGTNFRFSAMRGNKAVVSDVIQFNNGMHGWQHSETEYEQAFPEYLNTIQKYAPNAKLIWANITPLKVSPNLPPDNQAQATDARIATRNTIALKFVQAKGIPLDDLNSLVRGHPEYHSDNVHFNSQGISLEANQVVAQIAPWLNR